MEFAISRQPPSSVEHKTLRKQELLRVSSLGAEENLEEPVRRAEINPVVSALGTGTGTIQCLTRQLFRAGGKAASSWVPS